MNICYFGDYNQNYSRHKILLKGFEMNNVEVSVVNLEPEKNTLKKYWIIFNAIRKIGNKYDLLFIAYSNSRFVWFAKLLTKKPIIWDPFYSIYENWVFDRKITKQGSLKARYYWFLDWICSLSADLILLDTYAHIDFFSKEFHIKKEKFIRVLVGADNSIMYPREKEKTNNIFTVFFYGSYIPVQGADVLVRAAKILEKENISFVMLGQGQDFSKVKKLYEELGMNNIKFIPKVPFTDLPNYIADADVCMGLLSNIARGFRAIPNKIYDATAMGKACINIDSPAIKELYSDNESIVLFRAGDAKDLAEKILVLKNNQELRMRIGVNAEKIIKNIATPEIIGKTLINDLKKRFFK